MFSVTKKPYGPITYLLAHSTVWTPSSAETDLSVFLDLSCHLKWFVTSTASSHVLWHIFTVFSEKSTFFKITLPLLYIAKKSKNWKSVSLFWGSKLRQSLFFLRILLWGLLSYLPKLKVLAFLEPLENWGPILSSMTSYHPNLTKSFFPYCNPDQKFFVQLTMLTTRVCLLSFGELGKEEM